MAAAAASVENVFSPLFVEPIAAREGLVLALLRVTRSRLFML